MPELPEVETIARQLDSKLKGLRVVQAEICSSDVLKNTEPKDFKTLTKGRKVLKVSRRGKLILIDLEGKLSIIIHLRLTGRVVEFGETRVNKNPTTRAVFYFEKQGFRFDDLRKFGGIWLVDTAEQEMILSKLGPEPLDNSFNLEEFSYRLLQKRGKKIKPLLMDQSFLAGIGNIYADEILYFAKVRPDRMVFTLTDLEIKKIFEGIKKVLKEAVKAKGTSFRDYVDFSGKKGSYFFKLKVYQREGKPCYSCGLPVKKVRLGGRGTRYCPSCQR